jgi:ligand-binding sensor domain-containing protein
MSAKPDTCPVVLSRDRAPIAGAERVRRTSRCAGALVALATALLAADRAGAQRIPVERFGAAAGLEQSVIADIIQDRTGFLWLATSSGLVRFDGSTFRTYKNDPSDQSSLRHDSITALQVDASGALWVGSDGGGLARFDPVHDSFAHFGPDPNKPESLSSSRVLSLCADRKGRLWVGTSASLDLFDSAQQTFSHNVPAFEGVAVGADLAVWAIWPALGKSDVLWVGTSVGLFRFDVTTSSFSAHHHERGSGSSLPDNTVRCIFESTNEPGILWIGTDNGLGRLATATTTWQVFRNQSGDERSLSSNRVRAIFEDDRGVLWICTDGGGLCRMDRNTGTFARFALDPQNAGLSSESSVLSIYQDRSGLLWIGTSGDGLCKLDYRKAGFVMMRKRPDDASSLEKNDVLSIWESQREPDILWAGNQDGGLNRIDRATGKVTHFLNDPEDPTSLSHNSVFVVREDRDGDLWVGTRSGLCMLPRGGTRFTVHRADPTNPARLRNDFISSLLEDPEGRIWVGTRGGLSHFDKKTGAFGTLRSIWGQSNTLSSDVVLSLLGSPVEPGILWVGTGAGLNRLEVKSGTVRRFGVGDPTNPPRAPNYVMALYQHPSEREVVWLGTLGGLIRVHWPTGTYQIVAETLPSKTIYAILPEIVKEAGKESVRLWLSTNNGLARFDPATGSCQPFGVLEGVEIVDFNYGAAFVSPSGEMLFGGTLGLLSFWPLRFQPSKEPVPLVITGISVMERELEPIGPVLASGELRLPSGQGFVGIDFAALELRLPQRIKYAYKLEGIDPDWVRRGWDRRFASYTTLPAGAYTFRLRAWNRDGVQNPEDVTLRIVVAGKP